MAVTEKDRKNFALMGKKGGAKRSRRLTKTQRQAIARMGGLARWFGKKA